MIRRPPRSTPFPHTTLSRSDQPDVSASATTINEDGTSDLTITLNNAAGLFENPDDSVSSTETTSELHSPHHTVCRHQLENTYTQTGNSAADLSVTNISPAHY